MDDIRKKSFLFGIIILILSFISISQSFNPSKNENITFIFSDSKIKPSLIISEPINIDEAQDWIDLKSLGKCTGEGTQIDPYIISNLKINGKGSSCIGIHVSDVYYKIMNCELYNGSYGINMDYGAVGDIIGNNISYNSYGIMNFGPQPYPINKKISNNIISHNEQEGISSGDLYDCEISNNSVTYNGDNGIVLGTHNEMVKILNNNISNNNGLGLWLLALDNGTIAENIINYNKRGIELQSSDNNTFIENNINYNEEPGLGGMDNYAILFGHSNQNSIIGNNITDNGKFEFYFEVSSDNFISNNLIIESYYSYFYETGGCSGNQFIDNIILHDDTEEYNDFFYDASQVSILDFDYKKLVAIDDDWYRIFIEQDNKYEISISCSESGEFLDLYIYDSSQNIIKMNNSELYYKAVLINATTTDFYYIRVFNGINYNYSLGIHPYQEPPRPTPPEIMVNSPISNQTIGSSAPSYDLSIIETYDTIWYTLDGGAINITSSGLIGMISQTEWDKKGNEIVTITFYANNSVGMIGSAQVQVRKYVSEEKNPPEIPGYNSFIVVGILSIVSIVFIRIMTKKVEM